MSDRKLTDGEMLVKLEQQLGEVLRNHAQIIDSQNILFTRGDKDSKLLVTLSANYKNLKENFDKLEKIVAEFKKFQYGRNDEIAKELKNLDGFKQEIKGGLNTTKFLFSIPSIIISLAALVLMIIKFSKGS